MGNCMKKKICNECRGVCHICSRYKNINITADRRFSISLEKIINKKKIAWKIHERHIGTMPSSSCKSCTTLCDECNTFCDNCGEYIICRGHGVLGPSFYKYK